MGQLILRSRIVIKSVLRVENTGQVTKYQQQYSLDTSLTILFIVGLPVNEQYCLIHLQPLVPRKKRISLVNFN